MKNEVKQKGEANQKNGENKRAGVIFRTVCIVILIVAILLDIYLIIRLLSNNTEPDVGKMASVATLLGGLITAISAGLLFCQLLMGERTEQHQNEINKGSFIFQYNQAFIQNTKMATVERLLEGQAFYIDDDKETFNKIINARNRQNFIDYLVYLEGIYPLIKNNVLDIEDIDDLMAYRFFLALDNVEVQKEVKDYPEYYRGCIKLYKIWRNYRKNKGKGIPLDDYKKKYPSGDKMKALNDEWPEFETYAKDDENV